MAKFEVILPAMGEGIIEATITKWLTGEGTEIEVDMPLVEVATDKVDSEIPSPVSGVLSKVFYHEGEIPKVGEVIAVIETNGEREIIHEEEEVSETKIQTEPVKVAVSEKDVEVPQKKQEVHQPYSVPELKAGKFISPFIRNLARERNITIQELSRIQGTGLGGRITKDDLNHYIIKGRMFREDTTVPAEQFRRENLNGGISKENNLQLKENEELIEMSRLRKLIANHMVQSRRISPHVTSFVEIDMTSLVQWRNKVKENFFSKYKVKLTYTPIFVEAVVKAIKDFPLINVSVKDEYVILKKYINIGVATALPSGDLIVPVIKDADKENLAGLAIRMNDLAGRARINKLEPSEVVGGTFTITNMGHYDNVTGTPIINQPEVAILAVGAILRKPAVVKSGQEESIGVRDILMLSLTYDHRVVDGSLGGNFLRRIAQYLEDFDTEKEV